MRRALSILLVALTCSTLMANIQRIPRNALQNTFWHTIFTQTLDADVATYTNYSLRCVIPSASISGSGTSVKVTLKGPLTGEGSKFDHVSIVPRSGTSADGTTTPTELLFSGASGVTITAGTEATSDEVTFSISNSSDYLVIVDISSDTSNDDFIRKSATGPSYYYKATTDSYNQQTVTGFTNVGSFAAIVSKIEAK